MNFLSVKGVVLIIVLCVSSDMFTFLFILQILSKEIKDDLTFMLASAASGIICSVLVGWIFNIIIKEVIGALTRATIFKDRSNPFVITNTDH